MPNVSILLIASLLQEQMCSAISSIQSQQYRDWELLIISSDSDFDSKPNCPIDRQRVKFVHNSPVNLADSRNSILLSTESKYFAFLDSRDMWQPTKLQRQVSVLENNEQASFCSTRFSISGSASEPANCESFNTELTYSSLLEPSSFLLSSALFRKSHLAISGLLDPLLPACQEFDLVLKLARFANGVHLASSEVDRVVDEDFNVEEHYCVLKALIFLYRKHLLRATLHRDSSIAKICRGAIRKWESEVAKIVLLSMLSTEHRIPHDSWSLRERLQIVLKHLVSAWRNPRSNSSAATALISGPIMPSFR